jgi:IMP dehydrogenase/acetoin utilization protein AcuB
LAQALESVLTLCVAGGWYLRDVKNVSIARVMTSAPATVAPTATIVEAERLMRENACHHLPVVEAGKVVGMLAAVDLLKALVLRPDAAELDAELLRRAPLGTRHVVDVMQRNVRVLPQTATLLDAARALATGAFHAVPVVAADGRPAGIVTSTDVIEALAEGLEQASGGEPAPPTARPGASAEDAHAPLVQGLRELYRAVRNYLSSGRAEIEHTRLVQAADRARDALHSAGIRLGR